MAYTEHQIQQMMEKVVASPSLFYKQSCINYRGTASDTGRYFTEVISEWLLEHLEILYEIRTITRASSYRVTGHDGVPEHSESNREEELIAMSMKRQGLMPLVGEILDYQVPLKNKSTDKAGKIDLLAYDGHMLRILELKEPDSKETMLRCVLEGYTYLKTVNTAKLLSDFELSPKAPVKACPFVFKGGAQWNEMQQNRPMLKKLMAALDSKAYYISTTDGQYTVTEE